MSPDRKPGLDLSQQQKESLRETASRLNAELEGGLAFGGRILQLPSEPSPTQSLWI